QLYNFLSYRHHTHQYLHSFPTRRSSDLFCLMAVQAGNSFQFQKLPDIRMERRWKLLKNCLSLWHGLLINGKVFYIHMRPPSLLRSEEHTSELQSRFDLVCRLLLEKKKTT